MTTRRAQRIGQRFGCLIILSAETKRRYHVLCLCDCGVKKEVRMCGLTNGRISSCGCRQRHVKHLRSETSEYNAWEGMKGRCFNPRNRAYYNYGGRGITVCERWRTSFENFYADMGPRPAGKSLDRYPDPNGNYEPGNCRWATAKEQARNTRVNRLITHRGETLTLAEWTERTGLPLDVIGKRLRKGWNVERAILTPLRK